MSLKSEWQASALPRYGFSSFTIGVGISPFLDWWLEVRENLQLEPEPTPNFGCEWYYSQPNMNNLVRVQVRNEFFYAPRSVADQHQDAIDKAGTRWKKVLQRHPNVIRLLE